MVDIQLFGRTVDSGLFFGILMALLGIIGLIYAYFERRKLQQGRKLKDIDRQLTELYLPMEKEIKKYKHHQHPTDDNIVCMDKENLKDKMEVLKIKYPGGLDNEIIKYSNEFFAEFCPVDVLLHAVSIKISQLQDERKKYLK